MKRTVNHSQPRAQLQIKKISLILLIALLCSFIGHAEHFDLSNQVAEKQQCQLCQHNVDTPKEVNADFAFAQFQLSYQAWQYDFSASNTQQYYISPLRAPPVIHP